MLDTKFDVRNIVKKGKPRLSFYNNNIKICFRVFPVRDM